MTGRDGKQYAATRPQPKPASKPADQEPEAEAAPVIRSVALGKAQEAINIMMTIPPGDAQRARAFEMITSWIKLNATRQR